MALLVAAALSHHRSAPSHPAEGHQSGGQHPGAGTAQSHWTALAAAARVKRDWRSGVFAGHSRAADEAFASWRGAPLQSATLFYPAVTWEQLENPRRLPSVWGSSSNSTQLVLSTALWPSVGGSLAAAASGRYDKHFAHLARHLVAGGLGSATIRLGWEFNGTWFRWSARNPHAARQYAAAWRHIVTAMRRAPGGHFRFLWCENIPNAGRINPADAYPGNRYVSYVGTDLYDLNPQPNRHGGRSTPKQRWRTFRDGRFGLRWLAHFARAHHKPLAVPEWGLVRDSRHPHAGGGDDPAFVLHMYRWFAGHHVALENYFNTLTYGRDFRISSDDTPFPKSAALYRALYNQGS